jgi:hypothetical protein
MSNNMMDTQPLTTDLSPLQLVSSSKIYDNVYSSEDTTRSSGISVYSNGLTYEQSATTTSMGSVVTLNINNVALLNTIYLNLRLVFDPSNKTCLNRAWGFQAVDRISWRIGSSASYEFDGMTNYLAAVASCETREKCEAMLDSSGNQRYSGVGNNNMNLNILSAVVPICVVPFSTYANNVLPYDSSLLNSPIQVTITLSRGEAYQIVSDLANVAIPGASIVNQYNDITFSVDQNLFENAKADSLKMDMLANPVLINSYPYLFFQTATPLDYTASTTDFVNLNLTSFRRGNLVGIVLMPSNRTGNLVYNQNRNNDFEELQLSINGQFIHKFRSYNSMVSYLTRKQNKGPSYNIGELVDQIGFPPREGPGSQNLLYYLPLSQNIMTSVHHEFENGIKIQNQVLQLSVKNQSAGLTRLHVIYVYNSAIFTQNNNADIVF